MAAYENVLSEINDFGLYQKLRYLLICIAALLPPIGLFSFFLNLIKLISFYEHFI